MTQLPTIRRSPGFNSTFSDMSVVQPRDSWWCSILHAPRRPTRYRLRGERERPETEQDDQAAADDEGRRNPEAGDDQAAEQRRTHHRGVHRSLASRGDAGDPVRRFDWITER